MHNLILLPHLIKDSTLQVKKEKHIQKREHRTQRTRVSLWKKKASKRPTNDKSIHIAIAVLLLLTYGCLAGQHRGGQGAGRGSVQPGRPLDEVGRLLQKATGNADVVNPQETAAGE